MDDEPLVAQARAGDLSAAGVLLTRYQSLAYTAALRLLTEPADAEDIAQEALVRAYTHLSDLREGEAFGAWLRRITVNLSLNLLRRRGRLRFEPLSGEDDSTDSAADPPLREFADQAARGPEEVVLQGERVAQLDGLLRHLPEEQRVAVLLRDAYDYDVAEIAVLQRCGLSAAKMRISRGRATLRRLLADVDLSAVAGAGPGHDRAAGEP